MIEVIVIVVLILLTSCSSLNQISYNPLDYVTEYDYDCSKGVRYLNASGLRDMYGEVVGTVRRYLFLGDSTSRDSFLTFIKVFEYSCTEYAKGNLKLCTKGVKRDSIKKKFVVSTAEFFPYGRKQGWKRSSSKVYRNGMKGYVAQLGRKDVLVFNAGLHFDETATTHNAVEFYYEALYSLVSDLGLTGYSHQQRCRNISDPYLPFVMWRETLPQHFASSNGHYPSENKTNTHDCVPLTKKQRQGSSPRLELLSTPAPMSKAESIIPQSTVTHCDPSCLPANWQNHVANSLMQQLCIDIISSWLEFSCLYNQHNKEYRDCSHLSETGNYILLGHMLDRLFKELGFSAKSSQLNTLYS